MARLSSLERMGIPFALHSDLPMAPGQPLLLAWAAVNRIGSEGNALCPEERFSLHQAFGPSRSTRPLSWASKTK
jgi:predicted amidohydrolase YtcJ